MFGIDDAVGAGLQLLNKVIDVALPDPKAAAEAKFKVAQLAQDGTLKQMMMETEIIKSGADIVKAEAQSQSWLARNWRPMVMLVFTALIVARWFGWTAPNLSPAEAMELWTIVKIGMGGYVVGRSVEQTARAVAPSIAAALGAKKNS